MTNLFCVISFFIVTPQVKKTAIVMGSGGHTSEMLKLLSGLSAQDLSAEFLPREYIVARTDTMSHAKVNQFEQHQQHQQGGDSSYKVHSTYRSRHVGQSYLTSVFTTLLACLLAIPLAWRVRPRLLLVNGPGTCV